MLKLQADGSILASGANAVRDDYLLVCRPNLPRITAVRLEALPHPSIALSGPGRSGLGNFHLNEFKVVSAGEVVSLREVETSYAEKPFAPEKIIDGEIDGNRWGVWGAVSTKQTALFSTDFSRSVDDDVKLELFFSRGDYIRHNLGCFRLSVSSDPNTFARARQQLASQKLTDPWRRLAAAYALIGDQEAQQTILQQHSGVANNAPSE